MALSRERPLKVYQDMVMVHKFEEVIEEYAVNGTIPGLVHLSVGQEACQVGVVGTLKKTDYKLPGHRGHGATAPCGADPKLVVAGIFAKETRISRGQGGPVHVNDLEYRNMGFNGIQGSTMVTCPGTVFASACNGTDDVTAAFLGDGALGEGTYHESMNMTATWKLPITYCLISNGYAIFTHYEEAHPQRELKTRGEGYEVPSLRLGGSDIEAVIEAVEKAADRAGKGEGPTVLEFMTYRWQGHFISGPIAYRLEDEISYWVNDRDPLKFTKAILLEREQVEPVVLQAVEEEEEKHVQEMLRLSLESEYPGTETAATYTYADREVGLR